MGATQDNLSVSKLLTIPVPKYPVVVQDKIAAILTAYDDLIEVNKRRIALLEKMAEELYREWFVRMRFPGHQNTKFVKGVPVGWVTTRFASICKFIKGRTPSELTLVPREDHLPYINAAYLRGQEAEFAKRDRGCVICNDGDTLMLMDGSNSGLVFRAKYGIVASTFARISMHEKYTHYIFEFLSSSRDSILSNNTGSAVPHANKEFINRLIIYLPNSDQMLSDFNEKYEAIFQQKNILKQQIVNLTRTRDLLLPRLISGKLSVEDLDIQFPPSMREATSELHSASRK
jgi:type I restriction enzyme S subunit